MLMLHIIVKINYAGTQKPTTSLSDKSVRLPQAQAAQHSFTTVQAIQAYGYTLYGDLPGSFSLLKRNHLILPLCTLDYISLVIFVDSRRGLVGLVKPSAGRVRFGLFAACLDYLMECSLGLL